MHVIYNTCDARDPIINVVYVTNLVTNNLTLTYVCLVMTVLIPPRRDDNYDDAVATRSPPERGFSRNLDPYGILPQKLLF